MSVEDHRLKWKCRRGLLELDLILERFFMKYPGERGMDELLDLPDNDLLDIAMGRSDAFGGHLASVVARLRAA